MLAILLFALFVAAPATALADFTGRVVRAVRRPHTVLVNKAQIRVRQEGIDAPELGQAFGKRSRQSLANLCAAKAATVIERGKDRFSPITGCELRNVCCGRLDASQAFLPHSNVL